MEQRVALVILAAGKAERMGEPKQLMPYKKKPLIKHQVDKAIEALAKDVFVVLGAHKENIANALSKQSVHLIYNEKWEQGIGASISKAVSVISELDTYDGVLITLADQPLIPLVHYQELLLQFKTTGKSIIATKVKETIGVPAIFSKYYFSELVRLHDNVGAKRIIQSNKDELKLIALEDGYLDIDTPDDYQKLIGI